MKNNYTRAQLLKKRMSLFLPLSLFFLINYGYAQPVLTSVVAAPMGTKTYGYAITGSFSHTAAGAAQSWDYSTVAHDTSDFYFVEVPYSNLTQQIKDTFPNGNNASEYIQNGAKVATIVGHFGTTFQATLGLAFNPAGFQKYPTPDTFLTIPMNYQDAFDKRVYEAYGTLKTPFGTYTNVIRIKEDVAVNNKFRYLYFQFAPVFRLLMEYRVEKTTQAIDGKNFYNLDYTTPNGIENIADVDFQIYPNPLATDLNVKLPSTTPLSVRITNTLGETVYSINKFPSQSQKIDVSNLANGIYLINFQNEVYNKTHKIIIQH